MQIRSISAHRDAQSGLIGAPQPTSIEAVPAAPNGGSARVLPKLSVTQRDDICRPTAD
jgi:hypothetical protein